MAQEKKVVTTRKIFKEMFLESNKITSEGCKMRYVWLFLLTFSFFSVEKAAKM